MSSLREAAQQALEAMEGFLRFAAIHSDGPDASDKYLAEDYAEEAFLKTAKVLPDLRAALAQQEQEQTCNCRWVGDVQTQQCTLHEAHVDAIHEWAERAKTAEAALAQQEQEPVAVHQFREANSAVWYDGHADHDDGGGPYEERVLFTHPPRRETEQEPVVVMDAPLLLNGQPLFTHPPRREWQSLTEEEIGVIALQSLDGISPYDDTQRFARAIEQALKERNT